MRRVMALVVAAIVCVGMSGQDTKEARERVSEIRKMYSEAKTMSSENVKHDETRNDLEISVRQNVPGIGYQKMSIRMYYQPGEFDNDRGVADYYPYLITAKYNVAARDFYEEYLYDMTEHELVFVFRKFTDVDGTPTEVRYYWGKDGKIVHKALKGKNEGLGEDDMQKRGQGLVGVMNGIVNSDM